MKKRTRAVITYLPGSPSQESNAKNKAPEQAKAGRWILFPASSSAAVVVAVLLKITAFVCAQILRDQYACCTVFGERERREIGDDLSTPCDLSAGRHSTTTSVRTNSTKQTSQPTSSNRPNREGEFLTESSAGVVNKR